MRKKSGIILLLLALCALLAACVQAPAAQPPLPPPAAEEAEKPPVSQPEEAMPEPEPIPAPEPIPEPEPIPAPEPVPEAEPEPELPLSGCVIGIDAGHQQHANTETEPNAPGSSVMKMKVTGGTQGRFTGTPEYVVTLEVALLLRDLLEEQGASVVMTRETHEVDISNAARATLFNEAETDYALRLHCNGAENPAAEGAFMLVPAENPEYDACVEAAQLLIDAFCEETGAKNLGLTYRDDQTGFNWSERMVILIEMGHMTNEAEDYRLSDAQYQEKMAQGLLNGILAYFEGRHSDAAPSS